MIARRAIIALVTLLTATAHAAEPAPTPTPAPTPALTPAPAPTPTPEPKLVIKPNPRPDCPPRFSISLGAGAGLPIGASADRFDIGLHAAVDFRWFPDPTWALWVQTTLSLLPLVDGLPVEPGGGSGVSIFTFTIGAELREEVAADLELVVGAGLGLGGFGLKAADEALGWAFAFDLGARYHIDPNLAVRLDLAPVAIVPLDAERKTGGHLAIVVRGEAAF